MEVLVLRSRFEICHAMRGLIYEMEEVQILKGKIRHLMVGTGFNLVDSTAAASTAVAVKGALRVYAVTPTRLRGYEIVTHYVPLGNLQDSRRVVN